MIPISHRTQSFTLLTLAALTVLGLLYASPFQSVRAQTSDLFISEYIEGGSNNKAVEIYNGTGATVDLAAGAYCLQIYSNGSSTAGTSISLTGSVADGDVYVVADNDAIAAILAVTDQQSTASFYNGDDAVVLRKGCGSTNSVVDSLGQLGSDPGTEWAGSGVSTLNQTLTRKADICQGDPIADDAFDPAVEWNSFPQDTTSELGSHTANCGSTTISINEIQINTAGNDWEFFELQGAPGTDLTGLTLIGIESDTGTAAGTIDRVIDLTGQTIPADGFFLGINPTGATQYGVTGDMVIVENAFENSTATYLLVADFTGTAGTDLDADDAAPLDTMPWSAIVDEITVTDGGAGDVNYSANVAGPDGTNLPSGIYRCPDAPTGTFTGGGFLNFNTANGTPGVSNAALCAPTDLPPTVTSTTPAANSTDVALANNITINFSEAVDVTATAITLECPAATALTFSGLPTTAVTTVTLDPTTDLPPSTLCTVTLDPTQITDTDGSADQLTGSTSFTFTTVNPALACTAGTLTLISTIQGSGDASALDGTVATIEGIVVGDFQDGVAGTSGDFNGFYLQEESTDEDGNEATSEGIFVFDGNVPAVNVNPGDTVRVTGTVDEFSGLTELTTITSVEVCPPASSLADVTQRQVTLPYTDPLDLERYENMYVVFPQQLVIAEYFNFDRFGEIMLATPLSGEDRLHQPTAVEEPGSPAAADRAAYNALAKITLDDGLSTQNPDPARHPNGSDFTLANRFRGGDLVQDAVGVLTYSFNLYRLQPTAGATYIAANPRPTTPPAVGGTLKVASFNVLNYFTTIDTGAAICGPAADQECRGADNTEELARQRAKIVAALAAIDADVIGLIELENNAAAAPANDGVDPVLEDLVAALNGVAGAGTYAFVDTGVIGTDAIKVAFLYKPATVALVGDPAILTTFDGRDFISPFNNGPKNRPALAQSFRELATDEVVTVAVNHLKSKGSDCGGAPDDDPQQGNCNGTRTESADILAAWLASDPTGSGDGDVLIIGDLNAYDQEDPITVLKADGYSDLLLQFGGELAYSYLFDGQYGYLDYALANQTLATQVTGAAAWQINADEPDLLDYDTSFKQPAQDALYEANAFRASDHDPVLVGLNLATASTPPTLIFISPDKNGRIGNLRYRDEDILLFDSATASWSIFFDGSDVGVANADLDAFTIRDDGSILMSFDKALRMPIGAQLLVVDDTDVVRFVPTQLGTPTAGTFELFFVGASLDLTKSAEDIDAIGTDQDGNLVVSTIGTLKSGNVSGGDEDLFTVSSPSNVATSAISLLFDGSAVGLTTGSEDITGIWLAGDQLYLTTKGNFAVQGSTNSLSGNAQQIFLCQLLATGTTTDCLFSAFFDAGSHGLRSGIDGFALGTATGLDNLLIVSGQESATEAVVEQFAVIEDAVDGEEVDEEVDAYDQPAEGEEELLEEQLFIPFVMR